MSTKGIRGISSLSNVARAIRQLEERFRDVIGHWHAVATTREAGFLSKLSGDPDTYVNGVGEYTVPPGSGGVPATRTLTALSPITGGGDLSVDRSFDFDETAALGNNARVTVRKNTGADVGTRRRLNLIEGTNVTLTIADDAGSEEVDVTIASTGGSGTFDEGYVLFLGG